jgi:hypothetical protein
VPNPSHSQCIAQGQFGFGILKLHLYRWPTATCLDSTPGPHRLHLQAFNRHRLTTHHVQTASLYKIITTGFPNIPTLCPRIDSISIRFGHDYQMADTADLSLFTLILLGAACIVSAFVVVQVGATYTSAYLAAPNEITTFIDAVDFSIQENESYDRDVAKVQRLEDKLRMGKLLREIQKCGDDLREDLNSLLIEEGGTRLRSSTRLLWATKRKRLEESVRRLDLLRMRFLVVYMGLVAARGTSEHGPAKDPEKHHTQKMPVRPSLPHALTEGITRKPPLRRLTTQAMGHGDNVGSPQRQGWAGVVAELQNSPLMHKRHASIETSMTSPR